MSGTARMIRAVSNRTLAQMTTCYNQGMHKGSKHNMLMFSLLTALGATPVNKKGEPGLQLAWVAKLNNITL